MLDEPTTVPNRCGLAEAEGNEYTFTSKKLRFRTTRELTAGCGPVRPGTHDDTAKATAPTSVRNRTSRRRSPIQRPRIAPRDTRVAFVYDIADSLVLVPLSCARGGRHAKESGPEALEAG